jgi:hypothetical protein
MSECEACGTDPYELDQYIAELEARASTAHAKGREEVLKLREELKTLAASGLEAVKYHQAELATLRPAAEALKTAVELKMGILILSDIVSVDYPDDEVSEVLEGDPLAATIKAINRAAEAVKENGK